MARKSAIAALALVIAANFLGYALVGSNGILRLDGYRRLKGERLEALGAFEAERSKLSHHVELLGKRGVDPDLADEMVRRGLGLVRPDEVIVAIRD